MNRDLVLFLLGKINIYFGLCFFIPLIVDLNYGEGLYLGYISVIMFCFASYIFFGRKKENLKSKLKLKDVLAIMGLGILFQCLIGSIPYLVMGSDIVTSIFESVSGFTTTGTTSFKNIEILPNSILTFRAITQWLGGLSVMLSLVALVPHVGNEATNVFTADLHGESAERIRPRTTQTVKVLVALYFAITAVIGFVLLLGGMGIENSYLHAMTIVSTGGFSTLQTNMMEINNTFIQLFLVVAMFLAGGNYVLYAQVYKNGIKAIKKDAEFKAYFGVFAIATVLISLNLYFSGFGSIFNIFLNSSFHVSSFLSTTGFYATDYNSWPDFSKMILFILMFIGGCAGSTAGGIKVGRIVLLLKLAWFELKRTIHPRMIISIKMANVNIHSKMLAGISKFFFLYMSLFAFLTMGVSLVMKLDMFSSMAYIASCMGNIGIGFNMVAPKVIANNLTSGGMLFGALAMLFGRLEIFTLLIFLQKDFWKVRNIRDVR